MSNNVAPQPFSGLPPELRPEALEGFEPFYRDLLVTGWIAKRELADLKRWLGEHRAMACFQMDEEMRRERERTLDDWLSTGP